MSGLMKSLPNKLETFTILPLAFRINGNKDLVILTAPNRFMSTIFLNTTSDVISRSAQ